MKLYAANGKCPACGVEGGGFSARPLPGAYLHAGRLNRPHRRRGRARSPKSIRNARLPWRCRTCGVKFTTHARGEVVGVTLADMQDENIYETIQWGGTTNEGS